MSNSFRELARARMGVREEEDKIQFEDVWTNEVLDFIEYNYQQGDIYIFSSLKEVDTCEFVRKYKNYFLGVVKNLYNISIEEILWLKKEFKDYQEETNALEDNFRNYLKIIEKIKKNEIKIEDYKTILASTKEINEILNNFNISTKEGLRNNANSSLEILESFYLK